jgi:hypothetical protein
MAEQDSESDKNNVEKIRELLSSLSLGDRSRLPEDHAGPTINPQALSYLRTSEQRIYVTPIDSKNREFTEPSSRSQNTCDLVQQVPWRFRLEEARAGRLKNKVRARLRIEPPGHGGRVIDFNVDVPTPTEQVLGDLPWYCCAGRRLNADDRLRADAVEDAVQCCGEEMMAAVLSHKDAYAYWKAALNSEGVMWELQGSAAFQRLPWEWLADRRGLRPALMMHLRRRMTTDEVLRDARMSSRTPLQILWVTARPSGKPEWDAVLGPVREALGGAAEITLVPDGSYVSMLQYLREHERRPCFHLLHLDMHGIVCSHGDLTAEAARHPERWQLRNRSGGRRNLSPWEGTRGMVFFEDGDRADPVTAGELAAVLSQCRMPMVALSAPESGLATEDAEQNAGRALAAELVTAGCFAALGFAQALTVDGAALFFREFYRTLAASPDAGHLDEAVRKGRLALHDVSLRHGVPLVDWHLPVFYVAH